MRCSQVRRKLSAFLDRELPGPENSLVASHVATCPACQQELQRLTRLADELGVVPEVEVRPDLMARLRRRLATAPRQSSATGRPAAWVWRVAIPVGAAAVLCVAALAGSYFGRKLNDWRTSAATPGYGSAGSILFDSSPEDPLAQSTDELDTGGAGD